MINAQTQAKQFWPNGARLAVSISMMFEGGGQPISGAGGPIPEPIKDGLPDLPTNAFFAYGYYEGIPRALDLFDKHGVKDEFDQLYEEGATRRRMMLVGFHDRINGHANRIRVFDRFLAYAKSHDVWFVRKNEIAKWVLEHREDTPVLKRGPASVTGLPG